jgi:hypothetical protein
MQIGLNFWVGCGLDIIGSHFFLVFVEIGQLFFHILVLDSVLLLIDVVLFLVFNILGPEFFIFE